MNTLMSDNELEAELQELYILAKHWQQDISFLENETRFFRSVLSRYQPQGAEVSRKAEFLLNISAQEERLETLKNKIPAFLSFLEPFIGNLKKEMDLSFLSKYNQLETELRQLFNVIKTTKAALFHYTESIMSPIKTGR